MQASSPSTSGAHDISLESVLQLSGADARLFLQGQTTADFKKAAVGAQLHAAFCNSKGRVLADTLAVVVAEDIVLLRGRESVMTELAIHLKPYLAFSKSALTRLDLTVHCHRVESAAIIDPERAEIYEKNGALSAVAIGRGKGFVEYWHTGEAPIRHDSGGAISLTHVDFEMARARIEATTVGAYLPQDLDYDLNGTVSFSKGCYTGQEIVARLHYRGTPKRRLYRATLPDTAQRPVPGDGISNEEGQRVGSLVNILSLNGQLGALLEVVPEATSTPLFINESQLPLLSLAACHPVADQSIGS